MMDLQDLYTARDVMRTVGWLPKSACVRWTRNWMEFCYGTADSGASVTLGLPPDRAEEFGDGYLVYLVDDWYSLRVTPVQGREFLYEIGPEVLADMSWVLGDSPAYYDKKWMYGVPLSCLSPVGWKDDMRACSYLSAGFEGSTYVTFSVPMDAVRYQPEWKPVSDTEASVFGQEFMETGGLKDQVQIRLPLGYQRVWYKNRQTHWKPKEDLWTSQELASDYLFSRRAQNYGMQPYLYKKEYQEARKKFERFLFG